jgi:hypothetical protein
MFRRPVVVTLALLTLGATILSWAQGFKEISDSDALVVACPDPLTETLSVSGQ